MLGRIKNVLKELQAEREYQREELAKNPKWFLIILSLITVAAIVFFTGDVILQIFAAAPLIINSIWIYRARRNQKE